MALVHHEVESKTVLNVPVGDLDPALGDAGQPRSVCLCTLPAVDEANEDEPFSRQVQIILTTASSRAFDEDRFSDELDALLDRHLGDADPNGEGWLTIYSYLTGSEHEQAQQFFE